MTTKNPLIAHPPDSSKICWPNIVACLTMSLEGVLFFGTIMGWPNLAEIYKTLGVYEAVCDRNLNTTELVNGIVNCPDRDIIFTYVYALIHTEFDKPAIYEDTKFDFQYFKYSLCLL